MENSNSSLVEAALKKFAESAQELANVLDTTDYELSKSAPEYMKDPEDFAYEITQFVEDELEELSPVPS